MSLRPLYVFLGEVSVQVLSHCLIGLFVFLEWSPIISFSFWVHISILFYCRISPSCISNQSIFVFHHLVLVMNPYISIIQDHKTLNILIKLIFHNQYLISHNVTYVTYALCKYNINEFNILINNIQWKILSKKLSQWERWSFKLVHVSVILTN